ncbi:ornithine cyclodeaminase [Hypericibacter terrae]|uniref:Ornithine cyclodeaminase n=1 Tax=Hypericibacter terrae TaxID=2602015 RepID=A0A5J6MES3_9PROT|nr:ornithine cyclodeaminase family protein [Hypericibacter terrae]QEX15973.1 ornithine cyclodeaminase [Hypericibacter terrae]
MRHFDADAAHRLLDYRGLVEGLRDMYKRGVDVTERKVLHQKLPDGSQNDWLILPAWQFGRHQGIKLVSVFPGNDKKGLASILGLYVLFDGETGAPILTIDGAALTLRKTVCNSALAVDFCARKDASKLLVMGAGNLAPHVVAAHASVRPITEARIWNRTPEKAVALAARLSRPGLAVSAAPDLEAAVHWADIVTGVTMTKAPLLKGAWLKPGQHLDLIGAFRPDMREADDAAVKRSRLFIDARFSVLDECGDISQPLEAGLIKEADITDLFQLSRGERPGRQSDDEITLFKSGGGGHEDLATAQYLLSKV